MEGSAGKYEMAKVNSSQSRKATRASQFNSDNVRYFTSYSESQRCLIKRSGHQGPLHCGSCKADYKDMKILHNSSMICTEEAVAKFIIPYFHSVGLTVK